MQLTLKGNHSLVGKSKVLGLDGENKSEVIEVTIEEDTLLDKWAYMEFTLPNKSSFLSSRLPITDNKISFVVPSSLMKVGYLKLQVTFRDADNYVWKSFVIILTVHPSINADKEVEEDNPDFVSYIEKTVSGINENKVDKTTKINNHTLETDVELDEEDIGLSKISNEEIDSLFN